MDATLLSRIAKLWLCVLIFQMLIYRTAHAQEDDQPTHRISNIQAGVMMFESADLRSDSIRHLAEGTSVRIIESTADSTANKNTWCRVEVRESDSPIVGWVPLGALEPLRYEVPTADGESSSRIDWSIGSLGIAENPIGRLNIVRYPDFARLDNADSRIGQVGKATLVELLEERDDPNGILSWRRVRIRSGDLAGQEGWVSSRLAVPAYEVRFRTFIPSPLVALGIEKYIDMLISQQIFKGDNRAFSYNEGTDRTFQSAVVSFSRTPNVRSEGGIIVRGHPTPLAVEPTNSIGQTYAWKPEYCDWVMGKPIWWWRLNETREHDYGPKRAEENSESIQTTAEWEDENTIAIRFMLHAANPLLRGAPAIDAEVFVYLRRGVDGSVEARATGQHDGFPAYELYVNGQEIYRHDPVEKGQHPKSLMGTGKGEWDVDVHWTPIVRRR